jgi:tripartite-type tricarboxylate transporter receptor subunit TctC
MDAQVVKHYAGPRRSITASCSGNRFEAQSRRGPLRRILAGRHGPHGGDRYEANWRWFSIAWLGLLITAAGSARAQSDYPNNTVRIVVDSAAGSANDATSRVIGDRLSKIWNQQVITLNQPGAGGGISARVASHRPRTATRSICPPPRHSWRCRARPGVAPNLPVELPRDFAPVSYILEQPLYIGASHKSGINTIGDVIKMAKDSPTKSPTRPPGAAGSQHLTMELLQARTGTKLQLVPYAGRAGAGDERRHERTCAAGARRLRRACSLPSRAI